MFGLRSGVLLAQFPDFLRHLARQVQVNQHVLPLQVFQLNDALDSEKIVGDSLLRFSDLLTYELSFLLI